MCARSLADHLDLCGEAAETPPARRPNKRVRGKTTAGRCPQAEQLSLPFCAVLAFEGGNTSRMTVGIVPGPRPLAQGEVSGWRYALVRLPNGERLGWCCGPPDAEPQVRQTPPGAVASVRDVLTWLREQVAAVPASP